MNNTSINVFHNNWESKIIMNNNSLFKENDLNSYSYNYFINDHFLKITWNNNIINYFLSYDKINYYHYCQKYYHIFFENYSIYFIVDTNTHKQFLANHLLNICYDLNNIELYYFFDFDNNQFILFDENNLNKKYFIFFKNKYFEKSFFNKNFIEIYLNNSLFNNNLTLELKSNNFYNKINNIKGTYSKFGDYLSINYFNKNLIYKFNSFDNKFIQCDNNNIYSIIDNFDLDFIKNKNNFIPFFFDSINFINLIFYLFNHNFDIIIFDNIKNKFSNTYIQNIHIIYYKNIEQLSNIINIINNSKNIKFYFSNFKHLSCNKINLYSSDFNLLTNFFNLNIKFNDSIFKNYLKNNSIQKLDNQFIKYINNCNIPKILHFIWLGNNQFPSNYYLFLNSWIEKYNDFIFCFWNDDNIFDLFNQSIFNDSLTYAQKSDIARYEILYHYGGIYIDSDLYSIQNIEHLLDNIDFFSGFESDEFIAIGIMGFNKHNKYLKNLILNIELNYHLYSHINIPSQTGPVYFTNFYKSFINKFKKFKFFDINYFYNYSFQNKYNNLPIIFYHNNYCFHNWGYSWDLTKENEQYIYYYILKFIFSNKIDFLNNDNSLNLNNSNLIDISNVFKNKIFFYKSIFNKNYKKKIIHIMGYFFTGGIEKFIYDLDSYGDHSNFEYILLFLNKKNYESDINLNNFQYFYFYDNLELYYFLNLLEPDLIIDHYSQYINYNLYINNIYQNITIHLIHSAINYNKNIDNLNILKCIHLYDENNKHQSWNNIKHNYFNSLGIKIQPKIDIFKLNQSKINNINNKLIIAIIGRIVQEKIPILFLEKLSKLSLNNSNISIHIYGSKNNLFNDSYNNKFDFFIKNSNIELFDFVPNSIIYQVYHKINYLLIPSEYETGSYTCLEALSYGIPVIARNNYGLKKIIKNNINGHLLNSDDDIIDKLNYLFYDNLIHNYPLIYNDSLKFNLNLKINNFENIINNNLSSNNLIIITSVLNIIQKKLSYYDKRSVFDIHQRFEQTKKTIDTIKLYIPNCYIIFCECSNLEYYEYIEKYFKNNVNVYFNFYNDHSIRSNINSFYKGLGETSLLLKAIEFINNNNLVFDNIFKISGRYYLNDDFNFNNYNDNNNHFVIWDNNFNSYASLFYHIKFKYLNLLYKCFNDFFLKLKNGETLEILLNYYFNLYMNFQNITILNKHNISGYLSTEGYFFTI